jgi:hypothetical protein
MCIFMSSCARPVSGLAHCYPNGTGGLDAKATRSTCTPAPQSTESRSLIDTAALAPSPRRPPQQAIDGAAHPDDAAPLLIEQPVGPERVQDRALDGTWRSVRVLCDHLLRPPKDRLVLRSIGCERPLSTTRRAAHEAAGRRVDHGPLAETRST